MTMSLTIEGPKYTITILLNDPFCTRGDKGLGLRLGDNYVICIGL